jgi:ribosomal protein S18 acetylase RimI-like enzyme
MVAIRMAGTRVNAQHLFALFEENARDATHPRAVVAEGAADLWLAVEDGRLVGALLGRQMRSADGELRGGIDNLLVDAPRGRRGIGRRLMEEAEAHYRRRGLHGMQLAVDVDNLVARSLYDSMGYQIVKRYVRTHHDAAGTATVEQRLRM